MWQDQAATEAESMWSNTFSHFDNPVPWEEVKANIAYGNIAGSGYGYTLLHAFVELENELAVRFILWKGADVHAQSNSNGYTPLHLAIEKDDSSMVSLLLDEGADHLAQDAKGTTAWALAICRGDGKVIESMLSRGANVNESASENTYAIPPLGLAIEHGRENIVELLIKSGAQIEAVDVDGNTALINAAKSSNRTAIVQRLLQMGANVNASNNQGVTPLMIGVKSGSEEMVTTLIKKGPDLETKAHNGETALLIAAREGFRPIVLLLLEHGAESVVGYPRGRTPQDAAANYSIMEPLQQARLKKKKWFQRFVRDEMDEKYRSARLSALYKVYEEREMRERGHFSYVLTEEDMEKEERRETEEIMKRMNSVKM
jgi:ankyrin repeat protein